MILTSHYDVDISRPLLPTPLKQMLIRSDRGANRIAVHLFNGRMPYAPGGACQGFAVRRDGVTVPIENGVVDGNTLYIDLPAGAYALDGPVNIGVKNVSGSAETTVFLGLGVVSFGETDVIIDPGTIIPSVAALMAEIRAAVATIPADYSALLAVIAPTYSEHETYIAGQYVWHSGVLYRALQNILVPEAWTAEHWEEAPIAPTLYELRSGLSSVHDLVAVDSTNLYNANHTAAGYKIDTDGSIVSSPSYSVTEAFTVPAGKKIYLSGKRVSSGSRIMANSCRQNAVYSLNGAKIGGNTTQSTAYTYTNSTGNPVLVRFQLWGTGADFECTDYYVAIVDADAAISASTYEAYGVRLNPAILTANQQSLTMAQKTQARENIGVDKIEQGMQAALLHSDWNPTIVPGSYVNSANGVKATSSTGVYARTNLWAGYGSRVAVRLDNADYEYGLRFYGADASLDTGNGYLGYTQVSSGVQYIPETALSFAINFRRVDQAALTDGDITAILAALSVYAPTDTNLAVRGAAADAKTVGDAINQQKTRIDDLGVSNAGTITGWEQGRISGSSGGLGADTESQYPKHCRIETYLSFPGDATTLTVASGYILYLRGYTPNGRKKKFDASLNASTTDTLTIPDSSKYYRLDIARTDNADFTPDDLPEDVVTSSTLWQTDDTLSIPGKIADAGAVGDALENVENIVGDINGIEIMPIVKGYYTGNTNRSNVFVDGELPVYKSTSGWSYADIECQENDIFTIKGKGGKTSLLWCYIDAEGNTLDKALPKEYRNMEVIPAAPEGAARLICNGNANGLFVAKGTITSAGGAEETVRSFFVAEVTDTVNKVLARSDAPSLTLNIVTDTHTHTERPANQRWVKDMLANVRAVNQGVFADGIAHLGDLCIHDDTGMTQVNCYRAMNEIQRGLCAANERVYMTPGNHDGWEGHGPSTPAQNYAWMSKFNERYVVRDGGNPYFYVDIEKPKLRLVFVASSRWVSFDPTTGEPQSLDGINEAQLTWLGQTALDVEDGRDIIIFSHIHPKHGDFARNGIPVRGLCEAFNTHGQYDVYLYDKDDNPVRELYSVDFSSVPNSRIIVWQCGHSHYDRVLPFASAGMPVPVVVTTCSLCQAKTGTIPSDAVVPARTDETVTQDAWDTMIYRPDEGIIYYVRFGAGADRMVHYLPISISAAYTLPPSITPVSWASTSSSVAAVSDGVVTPQPGASGNTLVYAEDADGVREYWYITVPE